MKNVHIQWLFKGFEELRTGPEITRLVDDYSQAVVDWANGGRNRGFDWKSSVRTKKGARYMSLIYTGRPRAMVVNARDNTLAKAIEYARGLNY